MGRKRIASPKAKLVDEKQSGCGRPIRQARERHLILGTKPNTEDADVVKKRNPKKKRRTRNKQSPVKGKTKQSPMSPEKTESEALSGLSTGGICVKEEAPEDVTVPPIVIAPSSEQPACVQAFEEIRRKRKQSFYEPVVELKRLKPSDYLSQDEQPEESGASVLNEAEKIINEPLVQTHMLKSLSSLKSEKENPLTGGITSTIIDQPSKEQRPCTRITIVQANELKSTHSISTQTSTPSDSPEGTVPYIVFQCSDDIKLDGVIRLDLTSYTKQILLVPKGYKLEFPSKSDASVMALASSKLFQLKDSSSINVEEKKKLEVQSSQGRGNSETKDPAHSSLCSMLMVYSSVRASLKTSVRQLLSMGYPEGLDGVKKQVSEQTQVKWMLDALIGSPEQVVNATSLINQHCNTAYTSLTRKKPQPTKFTPKQTPQTHKCLAQATPGKSTPSLIRMSNNAIPAQPPVAQDADTIDVQQQADNAGESDVDDGPEEMLMECYEEEPFAEPTVQEKVQSDAPAAELKPSTSVQVKTKPDVSSIQTAAIPVVSSIIKPGSSILKPAMNTQPQLKSSCNAQGPNIALQVAGIPTTPAPTVNTQLLLLPQQGNIAVMLDKLPESPIPVVQHPKPKETIAKLRQALPVAESGVTAMMPSTRALSTGQAMLWWRYMERLEHEEDKDEREQQQHSRHYSNEAGAEQTRERSASEESAIRDLLPAGKMKACALPFVCKVCGKQFTEDTALKTHFLAHNSQVISSSFKCKLCDKLTGTQRTVYEHLKNVHFQSKDYPQESFHCYNCDMSCPTIRTFCVHENHCDHKLRKISKEPGHQHGDFYVLDHATKIKLTADGQIPPEILESHSCKQNKPLPKYLLQRNNKRGVCYYCDFSDSYFKVRRHMRDCHTAKKHFCKRCGISSANEDYERNHEKKCKVKGDFLSKTLYKSKLCLFVGTLRQMEEHLKRNHNYNPYTNRYKKFPKTFVCSTCMEAFTAKAEYDKHVEEAHAFVEAKKDPMKLEKREELIALVMGKTSEKGTAKKVPWRQRRHGRNTEASDHLIQAITYEMLKTSVEEGSWEVQHENRRNKRDDDNVNGEINLVIGSQDDSIVNEPQDLDSIPRFEYKLDPRSPLVRCNYTTCEYTGSFMDVRKHKQRDHGPKECPYCQHRGRMDTKFANHILTHFNEDGSLKEEISGQSSEIFKCRLCHFVGPWQSVRCHVKSHVKADSDFAPVRSKTSEKDGGYMCSKCGDYFGKSVIGRHEQKCTKKDKAAVKYGDPVDKFICVAPDAELENDQHLDTEEQGVMRVTAEDGLSEQEQLNVVGKNMIELPEQFPGNGYPKDYKCIFQCIECGIIRSRDGIKKHRVRVHKEYRYHCQYCAMKFVMKHDFLRHVVIHYDDQGNLDRKKFVMEEKDTAGHNFYKGARYKCTACGLRSTYKDLRVHVVAEHLPLVGKCKWCEKAFYDKVLLDKHESAHRVVDGKPLPVYGNPDAHKLHECEHCDYKTFESTQMRIHKARHHDEKNIPCPHCPKKFAIQSLLDAHLKLSHNPNKKQESILVCQICGKGFAGAKLLKYHELRVHSKIKVECPKCGRFFRHRMGLSKHIKRVHEAARACICPVCGKMLKDIRYLKDHMNIHTGNKPYKCPHCDMTYKFINTYRRHLITHKAKSHVCNLPNCGKSFYTHRSLGRHLMRVHKQYKPLTCEACYRVFPLPDQLLYHHCKGRAGHAIKKEPQYDSDPSYSESEEFEMEDVNTIANGLNIKLESSQQSTTSTDHIMHQSQCIPIENSCQQIIHSSEVPIENTTSVYTSDSYSITETTETTVVMDGLDSTRSDQVYMCSLCNKMMETLEEAHSHALTAHQPVPDIEAGDAALTLGALSQGGSMYL